MSDDRVTLCFKGKRVVHRIGTLIRNTAPPTGRSKKSKVTGYKFFYGMAVHAALAEGMKLPSGGTKLVFDIISGTEVPGFIVELASKAAGKKVRATDAFDVLAGYDGDPVDGFLFKYEA